MIYNSLPFWTLVAAVIAFAIKFYFPGLPIDNTIVLTVILAALGLLSIYPQVKAARAGLVPPGSILNSLAFVTAVCGVIGFVVHFYAPDFPVTTDIILALVLWALSKGGIVPEVRAAFEALKTIR